MCGHFQPWKPFDAVFSSKMKVLKYLETDVLNKI